MVRLKVNETQGRGQYKGILWKILNVKRNLYSCSVRKTPCRVTFSRLPPNVWESTTLRRSFSSFTLQHGTRDTGSV